MKYWLIRMKDKDRKLKCFTESAILLRRSRILGVWSFLCPFTYCIAYYAVKIYKNKTHRNSIGVWCKFVVSRLRNAKPVSSQVIWEIWLMAGFTFFLNLRFHCCKCNNVYRFMILNIMDQVNSACVIQCTIQIFHHYYKSEI